MSLIMRTLLENSDAPLRGWTINNLLCVILSQVGENNTNADARFFTNAKSSSCADCMNDEMINHLLNGIALRSATTHSQVSGKQINFNWTRLGNCAKARCFYALLSTMSFSMKARPRKNAEKLTTEICLWKWETSTRTGSLLMGSWGELRKQYNMNTENITHNWIIEYHKFDSWATSKQTQHVHYISALRWNRWYCRRFFHGLSVFWICK